MFKTSTNKHFYSQGLRFSCKRCSACCRFEAGFVFLSLNDVSLLVSALDIDYTELIETYCRWVPGGGGKNQLSLKEKPNYDCIFWSSDGEARPSAPGFKSQAEYTEEGGGCMVYEKRPLQCRLFPFWSSVISSKTNWKMTARDCPGMDQGSLYSDDSIKQMLIMRKMEPIISKNI
jgi:hypothetical protein